MRGIETVRKTQPPKAYGQSDRSRRSPQTPAPQPEDAARSSVSFNVDANAHKGHSPYGEYLSTPSEITRRPPPSQFDLIVTFANDQQARDALLALRHERFRSDQAVLLTKGPLNQGEFELATEALRSESYIALAIIIITELAIGTLLGAIIGWLVGLFHFAPSIGPIWQPILVIAGLGFCSALVVALLDIRRWRRVHLPTPGEAAVALRLRGSDAAARLAHAQQVLNQFGGHQDTA